MKFFILNHAPLMLKGNDNMSKGNISLTYLDFAKGIKKLTPDEQLRLLEIISAKLKKTLGRKKIKHSLIELEGLGADIWKGIDAQEFVHKERESWD